MAEQALQWGDSMLSIIVFLYVPLIIVICFCLLEIKYMKKGIVLKHTNKNVHVVSKRTSQQNKQRTTTGFHGRKHKYT